MEHEQWQWQEPGSAWKGAGLYHITLTVDSRRPVLGMLIVPDNNPSGAYVQRSPLGDALVDCLLGIPQHHPEVRVLHFCLMPDHLHAVLYVQRTMAKGIASLVRGFWQAAKKLGRAASLSEASCPAGALLSAASPSFFSPNGIRGEHEEGGAHRPAGASSFAAPVSSFAAPSSSVAPACSSFIAPNAIRGELRGDSARLQAAAATLRQRLGDEAYYRIEPLFTEMPFIRPMSRYSQLPTTIRYQDMNPQRLATKRLRPGFFRVQQDIVIGSRSYSGVGNVALLTAERYGVVHVRSTMVKAAEHGDQQPLRDYMNSRVLLAREGVVMVSPFISPQEKQVMQALLSEQHPFICLTDNGFRDYYKPADTLFDACAAGRLLILSPWSHDEGKHHISRADCVALNQIAEDICTGLSEDMIQYNSNQ